MALTWSGLIANAFQRVNIIQQGESVNSADQDLAFTYLQQWVEAMALDGLTIPYVLRTTFTITSTKGTIASPYLVGSGQDVNVTKPIGQPTFVRFQDTSVSPTLEYPMTPLTDDAWALIPQKNLTATLPTSYYYNQTYQNGTTNYGSLYLWPVPTQSNLQGVFYAPSQVPTPVNVTDTIVLPAGYQWFIQENIALIYASTFRENIPTDPALVRSAANWLQKIKRANVKMDDLSLDRAVLPTQPGRYNIFSDTYQ